MKTLATQFICCLLLSYTLQALPSSFHELQMTLPDSTKDEKKEIVEGFVDIHFGDDDDDDRHHWHNDVIRLGMLDIGISSYLDENGSLDMPEELDYMDQRLFRSINVGIHLINLKKSFHRVDRPQRFGFSTGVKWNIVHYSMEKDYQLHKDAPNYLAAIDYDVPELRKNRLKANYVQIPFMLEFNSDPNHEYRSINIGIGYVHQFLLNSNYKYKTEAGDKVKTKGEYNMTKSMGMVEGRIGYGPLNFYVQYGLKDLFQENNGPKLTPINFGVNIIPR